jgi:hypothetical protein
MAREVIAGREFRPGCFQNTRGVPVETLMFFHQIMDGTHLVDTNLSLFRLATTKNSREADKGKDAGVTIRSTAETAPNKTAS